MVIRGIGPSLAASGVRRTLQDPTLQLRDGNGTLIFTNNNWQDNPSHAAIVSSKGLAPSDSRESAIALTLSPGSYTAILAGLNETTGVGSVEAYFTE